MLLHLEVKNLLKSKKLRITPFRLEVLKVFQKYENALALDVIESEIGEHDRITLYRTIKVFIEAGVLHEILISGETKKLALCNVGCENELHDHNHIHFLCVECNETFCLEPAQMPVLEHNSFQITSMEIQAKGICMDCKGV